MGASEASRWVPAVLRSLHRSSVQRSLFIIRRFLETGRARRGGRRTRRARRRLASVPPSLRPSGIQSLSHPVTGRQTLFLFQMRDFPPPAVARRAEEGSPILPLRPWRTLRLNHGRTRRYRFQGETPPLPPSPRLWRTGAVGVTPGDARSPRLRHSLAGRACRGSTAGTQALSVYCCFFVKCEIFPPKTTYARPREVINIKVCI